MLDEPARRYADALGPALDAAAEAGIFLALENEFDSAGTDPTRAARFTRRVFDVVGAPEVFRAASQLEPLEPVAV